METAFKQGDQVWFISKFGDCVTGVYQRDEMVPGFKGDVLVHIVASHNAFGHPSREPVVCMVTQGKLNRVIGAPQ